MRPYQRLLLGLAASALLLAAQSDPPGRVGRLNYVDGAVSLRPGGVDDWVPAEINRPLTAGDNLWVDEGGRAELHIGTAALRLNSRTAFEFLNLDDQSAQIRLTEGSLHVRLRFLDDRETFEIDTPNMAFSLLRTGDYRIDVNPDTQLTTVTVREGEGEVTGASQAFPVRPGEQAQASGFDQATFATTGAPSFDEWDSWCSGRDRREDQSPSARYVSREMVGYQDLDDNGYWRNVPDYGEVWVPRSVAVGWAPYRYGHWAWVEPWGWTWVDDAPWGFAPFHYGRWAYIGYWAWVPGPVAVRPVYAPALVAWVGGPRFSLAIGMGGGVAGVAWFPLGPREVYVPAYHASPVYINRVNVTNTTIVNNINITNINTTNVNYINRNAPGAVTAVPQNAFAGARPVQTAAVAVRPEMLRSAQVINGAPVAPGRQSVLGSVAPAARVAQPPAAVQTRPVVARVTPPPPPVPFAQKQQALAANPGRPLDSGQVQQLRAAQPAAVHPYVRQARAPQPAGQFNRPAGQPAQPNAQQPGQFNRPTGQPAQPNVQQPGQFNRPAGQPPPPNPQQPGQFNRPANQPPARTYTPPPSQNNPPPAAQPRPPVNPRPAEVPPPNVSRPAPREAPRPAEQPRQVQREPQNRPAEKGKQEKEDKRERKE